MPTLPRLRGFTLIEVLVALVIIAIVSSAVVIGLSGLGGNRDLAREARRLQARIDFACETALLNGRSIGLVQIGERGYAFVERIAGRWQPVAGQPALAQYRMPANMQLQLRRDGRKLAPAVDADENSLQRPQIACFAAGELTPFTAVLEAAGADQRYTLVGHIDMQTELHHAALTP